MWVRLPIFQAAENPHGNWFVPLNPQKKLPWSWAAPWCCELGSPVCPDPEMQELQEHSNVTLGCICVTQIWVV